MKKLLFVAVLLTAGFVEQVNASSNAQLLYQNFQNSLVAMVQAAQQIDNTQWFSEAYTHKYSEITTKGIPDFKRLITLLVVLGKKNLNTSLTDLIKNMQTIHSDIVYYTFSDKDAWGHPSNSGFVINARQFIDSFEPQITNFINAAIALNIPNVDKLLAILEGLAKKGHGESTMQLSLYEKQLNGTATPKYYPSAAAFLPEQLKYLHIPMPTATSSTTPTAQ